MAKEAERRGSATIGTPQRAGSHQRALRTNATMATTIRLQQRGYRCPQRTRRAARTERNRGSDDRAPDAARERCEGHERAHLPRQTSEDCGLGRSGSVRRCSRRHHRGPGRPAGGGAADGTADPGARDPAPTHRTGTQRRTANDDIPAPCVAAIVSVIAAMTPTAAASSVTSRDARTAPPH